MFLLVLRTWVSFLDIFRACHGLRIREIIKAHNRDLWVCLQKDHLQNFTDRIIRTWCREPYFSYSKGFSLVISSSVGTGPTNTGFCNRLNAEGKQGLHKTHEQTQNHLQSVETESLEEYKGKEYPTALWPQKNPISHTRLMVGLVATRIS